LHWKISMMKFLNMAAAGNSLLEMVPSRLPCNYHSSVISLICHQNKLSKYILSHYSDVQGGTIDPCCLPSQVTNSSSFIYWLTKYLLNSYPRKETQNYYYSKQMLNSFSFYSPNSTEFLCSMTNSSILWKLHLFFMYHN
jgi:hypothetical protein